MTVPYWISYTIPAIVGLGILLGGWWLLLGPVMLFVLIPVVDALGGLDKENPEERDPKQNRDLLRDLPLWLWLPTHVGVIAWACAEASSGRYGTWEFIGAAFNVGLVGAAGGINVAHELMHRRGKFERAVAEIMMTGVSYTHFCVEHVHGHHRNVATPEDPATSRLGETVYRFYPRTLIGTLRSFLAIESARVAKRGRGRLGLGDRRARYALLLAATYAVVATLAGIRGVVFFALQSLIAVLLLETINYVEHYGLVRNKKPNGRYERVRPQHSWNASQRVTNWYLYNLQRHSDHHFLASRPYWQLRHYDDVPQLPFGYATALLVAMCPPLWRRVMDPRVMQWREREASGTPVDSDVAEAA
jgi:alkane 1-monooxygenase